MIRFLVTQRGTASVSYDRCGKNYLKDETKTVKIGIFKASLFTVFENTRMRSFYTVSVVPTF